MIYNVINMKNGYTLIELVISLGILIFVISLIMLFFSTNIKNFEIISNDRELQFQSQYILNFISNKVMESKKVADIRIERATSVINSPREWSITKISLLYNEQNGNCYIFEVKNNKIFYDNGKLSDLANIELGTYVTELCLAPYPEGKTFAEAKALKITIKLLKNNQVYEASQIIYMRNS